ncbi:hypothetical protein KC19_8G043900 [Ceratodon purpureus]|uniref:F-box domain-containing protein n=1 Tax=Ceratodon purpureus TaxID=3225 RepID=A0A8T0GV88_CERPU|nr:hypothetical protein KC19_8G043900 [Ceratodon purpureus]
MAMSEMESMWRDLPAEILENVFTFLPISSLCRFRTLSKRWNIYISSPAFRLAQASRLVSPEEYVVLVRFWGHEQRSGWNVLDKAKRKFLFLGDDFLRNHLLQRHPYQDAYLEAADGGLFCMRCDWQSDDITGPTCLFVCNPVLKTFKELPHLAAKAPHIVMSTDIVLMEYEIIAINSPTSPASVFVYESKIGSWRVVPYNQIYCRPEWRMWRTLTTFKNKQYWINSGSCEGHHTCEGIVCYDKDTRVVSDLAGLHMPFHDPTGRTRFTRHLVVSQDKLFGVMFVESLSDIFSSVSIFKINIAKEERIHMTEVPRELLVWVLGPNLEWGTIHLVVVTGSADSILISNVGRCAAYNLLDKSWYQCPDPLEGFHGAGPGISKNVSYSDSCCLSFCSP